MTCPRHVPQARRGSTPTAGSAPATSAGGSRGRGAAGGALGWWRGGVEGQLFTAARRGQVARGGRPARLRGQAEQRRVLVSAPLDSRCLTSALGSPRLPSAPLGSPRLPSAPLGSPRLPSAPLGSSLLSSAPLGSPRLVSLHMARPLSRHAKLSGKRRVRVREGSFWQAKGS